MAATGTYAGIGLALVVGAFFFVNLVPYPHQTGSSVTTESIVNGFQAHQLSLFGYNSPAMPSWALTTNFAVLVLAGAAFVRDGISFWEDHR